jgi:hypothetical protein
VHLEEARHGDGICGGCGAGEGVGRTARPKRQLAQRVCGLRSTQVAGQSGEHPARRSRRVIHKKGFNTEDDRGPRRTTENGLNVLRTTIIDLRGSPWPSIVLPVNILLPFGGSGRSPDCPGAS